MTGACDGQPGPLWWKLRKPVVRMGAWLLSDSFSQFDKLDTGSRRMSRLSDEFSLFYSCRDLAAMTNTHRYLPISRSHVVSPWYTRLLN